MPTAQFLIKNSTKSKKNQVFIKKKACAYLCAIFTKNGKLNVDKNKNKIFMQRYAQGNSQHFPQLTGC